MIQKLQKHDRDTGSIAMQIVQLSDKIDQLTEHCKLNPKDHSSKRGMIRMVAKRKASLQYLKRTNVEEYQLLLNYLNLKK